MQINESKRDDLSQKKQEIQTLLNLKHDNLIKMHAYSIENKNKTVKIVTELLETKDLFDYVLTT